MVELSEKLKPGEMPVKVAIQKRAGDFKLDIHFSSKARRIGILGASGSGKSMTLKCIAGIEPPDAGTIRISGRVFYDSATKQNVKPQKRKVGYLFQNYALFPAMTVAQNIVAGCKGKKVEKKKRGLEMLERFHLSGLADRLPNELSGGQQQRVALARMMAYQPEVILLDEPFSALDVFLKDQLQREMQEILSDYSGTVILVSHNRDEIYRFCEELVVIDQGMTVIHGKTKDIFEMPVYYEAARLTGCKNFSKMKRLDAHSFELQDWGITMQIHGIVPPEASCIGFRAHDFIPAWGERPVNSLKFELSDQAQLPFEHNYYLKPESGGCGSTPICWFVQRGQMLELAQHGMPDYLILPEDKVMFLREARQRHLL